MTLPDFVYRLVGKFLGQKLNLQEGYVPTKPWYLSKTVISNIVSGLIGIYLSLIASGVHLPSIPAWVITVLSGIGIYGRVTADTQVG